jgi:hypothetical protein
MSAPAPDRARHRSRRPRRLALRRRARAPSGFRRIHRLKLLTALLLTAALSVGLLLLSVVLATADAGFERERLDGRLRRQVAAARALLVAEPGDVARLAADDGLAGGYPALRGHRAPAQRIGPRPGDRRLGRPHPRRPAHRGQPAGGRRRRCRVHPRAAGVAFRARNAQPERHEPWRSGWLGSLRQDRLARGWT